MSAPHSKEYKEPEITPEMIEAGVGELRGFNRDFDDERDIVALIYAAMHRAASSDKRTSECVPDA
jgi:hypothetical protein